MNKEKIRKLLKDVLPYIIVVILVILVRSFIITPAVVDGNSMLPNLQDNNIIILNKLDYKLNDINRFDVVVINYRGEKLVKRVIGLPGEHVEYKDNKLYINGVEVEDVKLLTKTNDFKLEDLGVSVIPDNYYFVLGDNRTNSTDSRIIGLISINDIKGTVDFRIFPFDKFGSIE